MSADAARSPLRHDVRVRSEGHVGRLAIALIREAVPFDIRPQANGWWLIRATIGGPDLAQLEQATRRG